MYKQIDNTVIQRLSDNVFIPANEANADYQEYLTWEAEGNKPEAAEGPDDTLIAQMRLEALERETMMNRGLREFLMVSMQDLARRQSEQMEDLGIIMAPQDILAANSAWVKLVEINSQASTLRAQLK